MRIWFNLVEKHCVPKRSQRTRALLTFFAQDHASTEMVYANADITKAEQACEIIAFADYWQATTGAEPGLLVFDSQLTNYTVLNELTERGLTWLTPRKRGQSILDTLAASQRVRGPVTASTAPAATAIPTCMKTWCPSRALPTRSAKSPCAT
jgi:hypothetical protein